MNEDKLLVNEFKSNSSVAFEKLYKKYASRMKGVAYRYVNDGDVAEDILQEAFVKVFTKLKDFDNQGSFEAWLRRVVVNTAINYYHSRKKEHEKLAEYSISDENNPTEFVDDDDDYSLDDLLEAVNKLPEGYKMVFNLYAIDNYSHKEIAEAMNINEGTSKSQLFKARAFLKKELLLKKQVTNGR